MSFEKTRLTVPGLTASGALAIVLCGAGACSDRDAAGADGGRTESTSTRFHEGLSFPAVPPPECNAAISCSAISYKHQRKTCADLGGSDLTAKIAPLHFAREAVVALSPGETIAFTSTMRILVRPDGGETVYYSWSFRSTTPIEGVILRGDPATQPDSTVYRFDRFATTATGLQGAWIAWVCGEGRFEDSCLYPFDPVEVEICYRDPAPLDAGAGGGDGGKTW